MRDVGAIDSAVGRAALFGDQHLGRAVVGFALALPASVGARRARSHALLEVIDWRVQQQARELVGDRESRLRERTARDRHRALGPRLTFRMRSGFLDLRQQVDRIDERLQLRVGARLRRLLLEERRQRRGQRPRRGRQPQLGKLEVRL